MILIGVMATGPYTYLVHRAAAELPGARTLPLVFEEEFVHPGLRSRDLSDETAVLCLLVPHTVRASGGPLALAVRAGSIDDHRLGGLKSGLHRPYVFVLRLHRTMYRRDAGSMLAGGAPLAAWFGLDVAQRSPEHRDSLYRRRLSPDHPWLVAPGPREPGARFVEHLTDEQVASAALCSPLAKTASAQEPDRWIGLHKSLSSLVGHELDALESQRLAADPQADVPSQKEKAIRRMLSQESYLRLVALHRSTSSALGNEARRAGPAGGTAPFKLARRARYVLVARTRAGSVSDGQPLLLRVEGPSGLLELEQAAQPVSAGTLDHHVAVRTGVLGGHGALSLRLERLGMSDTAPETVGLVDVPFRLYRFPTWSARVGWVLVVAGLVAELMATGTLSHVEHLGWIAQREGGFEAVGIFCLVFGAVALSVGYRGQAFGESN